MSAPICPHCQQSAALVDGSAIYPHRPDLHAKRFYLCAPCGAYVGCHPGTTNALGTPANAQLRAARQRAHAAFDPIWQRGVQTRTRAYKWLAHRMGIEAKAAHIALFNIEQCESAITIIEAEFTP